MRPVRRGARPRRTRRGTVRAGNEAGGGGRGPWNAGIGGKGCGEAGEPGSPGTERSSRRRGQHEAGVQRREQHPGKEPPRLRTKKLPATLKSRVLLSVKISMGREENPEDEKRWSIYPIRDTRLRITFGGHHPSSGERRMVEEKGIEP